jgi:tetratricopeptide (TPR) repeat protein
MKQPSSEKIAAERERIVQAVTRDRWDEVATALSDLLWSLAEARPDFEELPSWIAESRASGTFGEHASQPTVVVEQVENILRSVVSRYGDDADRSAFAQMKSRFLGGRPRTPSAETALFAADVVERAASFREGMRRLPLAVHKDELHVGRHTRISFNRTLRVPEDGREYPLPAGFGRLPILRVEDYAERVPEKWLEQGGFIIPLYQREALFLSFSGVKWRPTIGKVSVGRVNAVSGKEHDLKIRSHRQDYVVIPDQHWLDGVNSGNGLVRQFVAMPLGKGYTIEAQVTDEEKYGGFQLAIFDPRSGRFPERNPDDTKAAATALERRARRAAQEDLLNYLPASSVKVIRAVQEKHYSDAAKSLGLNGDEVLRQIESFRLHFEKVLGKGGFDDLIPKAHLQERVLHTAQFSPSVQFQPPARSSKQQVEMGIAAGGTIKQQILEDTYGAESWDEAAFRDIVIHIVNSQVYQQITGREAPPSPISAEQYKRCKIPWYSDYKEKTPSLSPAAIFKRILSVGQIDNTRGIAKDENRPKREIQPEEIVRICTQNLEDRWKALLDRAMQSSKSGHHRIAAREASLALDLSDKHPLPFLIRAISNHHLGYHSDAEADASACLKLEPNNMGALSIRAYSSLALGEILLAKNDAEMILASQPGDHDGLYVRAEANLKLAHYKEAIGDAEKILCSDPANPEALRIRADALTKLSDAQQSDGGYHNANVA